jgi:hypothetical protein
MKINSDLKTVTVQQMECKAKPILHMFEAGRPNWKSGIANEHA